MSEKKTLSQIYWKDYLRDKQYNTDVDKECEICRNDQISKYGEIRIKCEGMKTFNSVVDSNIAHMFTDEQKDILEQAINPYHWANTNIDIGNKENTNKRFFAPRWHQHIMANCTATRKAIRCGRRCIDENELIQTKDGKVYTAKQLLDMFMTDGDNMPHILSLDTKTNKFVYTDFYIVSTNGIQECYRVVLSDGKSITATSNHPLLTINGWKNICDLKPGDHIAITGPNNQLIYEKIYIIDSVGEMNTIDLSVPEYENFVNSDGIVSHNTGKSYSLALVIAHRLLVNKDYKILAVTPFTSQIEEIFRYVRVFLQKLNPEYGSYDDLVVRDINSSPYLLELKNGSRLRGFTAGSNGAASVRGQSANLIVLDEVDYLDESAFNAIVAILADRPDTELWAASTPNGERILYRLSNTPEYKSFHYPSYVLPQYNDELDKDFRQAAGANVIAYIQEIMAEFGTSMAGVFQQYFIERACSHGSVLRQEDVISNRGQYIVTMGCDWNHDKIGTRIVVVAYDPLRHQFFIIDKSTVVKDGWTQVKAMEKIIELNRRYRFDHIYVDSGFGVSSAQVLKKYALDNFGNLPVDHPDLLLADLKDINFSSSVEIEDVIDQSIKKIPMKQYMVENTQKMLENELVVLSRVEDSDIIKQMINYEEKSRSLGGRVVYHAKSAAIGDHDLDALMLALLAFKIEYSDIFGKNKPIKETIQFIPRQDLENSVYADENTSETDSRNESTGTRRTRNDDYVIPERRNRLKVSNRTSGISSMSSVNTIGSTRAYSSNDMALYNETYGNKHRRRANTMTSNRSRGIK